MFLPLCVILFTGDLPTVGSAIRGVCLWGSAYRGRGMHPGGSASRGFASRGPASGASAIRGVCHQGDGQTPLGLPMGVYIDRDYADPPESEKGVVHILLECFLVLLLSFLFWCAQWVGTPTGKLELPRTHINHHNSISFM